jgi:hypothetical protein
MVSSPFFQLQGAEFVGPEGVQNAEHFLGIAAHGEVVHGDIADDAFRVDHEGGALANPLFRIENAERFGEFALDMSG